MEKRQETRQAYEVSVTDARPILGELALEAYSSGAETVLTRHGFPIARIVPLAAVRKAAAA